MSGQRNFDFLVIGSGIAGLTFALKVARVGSVAIITKKQRAESNTNYAQGGIAAVMAKDDSLELHVRDTLEAGAGLCKEQVVRLTHATRFDDDRALDVLRRYALGDELESTVLERHRRQSA